MVLIFKRGEKGEEGERFVGFFPRNEEIKYYYIAILYFQQNDADYVISK